MKPTREQYLRARALVDAFESEHGMASTPRLPVIPKPVYITIKQMGYRNMGDVPVGTELHFEDGSYHMWYFTGTKGSPFYHVWFRPETVKNSDFFKIKQLT